MELRRHGKIKPNQGEELTLKFLTDKFTVLRSAGYTVEATARRDGILELILLYDPAKIRNIDIDGIILS